MEHWLLDKDIRKLACLHSAAYDGKPVPFNLFATLMNLNYGWPINRQHYSDYCEIVKA